MRLRSNFTSEFFCTKVETRSRSISSAKKLAAHAASFESSLAQNDKRRRTGK